LNYFKHLLPSLLLVTLLGCSSESQDSLSYVELADSTPEQSEQQKRGQYLAYEHRLTITLAEDEIQETFEKISSLCARDAAHQCTMLHSSLNIGSYPSAVIQVRILPQGVAALLNSASEKGTIAGKSTDVEDLQDAIINGGKRLEMLTQYRARLLELEKKTDSNVESLIKVAQELSKGQSDIEYTEGEKARLLKRTRMDVVSISLNAVSYVSFWDPIANSLGDFAENFSHAIAEVIEAVAYLLPWLVILFALFYVLRIVWRKTRHKH